MLLITKNDNESYDEYKIRYNEFIKKVTSMIEKEIIEVFGVWVDDLEEYAEIELSTKEFYEMYCEEEEKYPHTYLEIIGRIDINKINF